MKYASSEIMSTKKLPLTDLILNAVTEHQELDSMELATVIRPTGWKPRTVRRYAQDLERAGRLYRKVDFKDMRRVIYVMPPKAMEVRT